MVEMKASAEQLTELFSEMFMLLSLITLCSFRALVRLLYAYSTRRKYNFSEIDYLDICIMGYYCYFVSLYYKFNKEETLEPFLIFTGLVNVEEPMSIFAVNMMFNADTRQFRFNWAAGVWALLICLKAVSQFSFTNTFGPIIKMI